MSSLPSSLDGWLRRCEQAHPVSIDFTIDRVRSVKERMGLRFASPVIMVGGTNGKGSTCAILESVALAAGWRVGLYSKPHLVHFQERCRVGGVAVRGEALIPHFAAVEVSRRGTSLTYFEHTTLAILSLLATLELDLVILEVGLGGRCDAVNVVDADCAVITSVDIDHADFLGDTREAIGHEKAGIFRPGRTAVVGDPVPPASVLRHARKIGSHVVVSGRDFRAEPRSDGSWDWHWHEAGRHHVGLPRPALCGDQQVQNASTALAALAAIERLPVLGRDVVDQALRAVRLSGRFQIMAGSPAVILDVAHNPHAVRALVANLRSLPVRARVLAVFGCMKDKDIPAMLALLQDVVCQWHFTDLEPSRAASARQLADMQAAQIAASGREGAAAFCWQSPGAALSAAREAAREEDVILVTGSFYTVGDILRGWDADLHESTGAADGS